MLFPTVAFATFFVVAFICNWLLRPAYRLWRLVLIGLSFWFYGYADERLVWLLAGSAVANWAFGALIHRAMPRGRPTDVSRHLVRAAVVTNLGLLGLFKYYGFFVDSIGDALGAIGLGVQTPVLQLILPVGISFFTFHAISYIVDIGRGELEPMSLGDFTLYLSFFPHLVAGPIVRASEFKPQMLPAPDPRRLPSAEAFRLIGAGLFKKVVVSSFLATYLVDPVFGVPGEHGALELLVGVYGYAIQIYADFSGYTDIAIGCALLLGFRFPQNFDAPYRALSVQDFWRRWHMTLSRWLRDYLYIPLGGSRGDDRSTYRNLFLTMLLGGLWHGAAWTFVVWGALHGGYLAAERYGRAWWAARAGGPMLPAPASAVLRWLVTFHLVCLAWIFFRADSLGTAFDIVGRILAGGGPTTLVTGLVVVTIVAALASQFVPTSAVEAAQHRFSRLTPVAQGLMLAGALTAIDVLGPDGVAPFIYFRF
ncbi:MAG: MBOAT family O-acyltransferase [Acidimicrobiales bacterium]